MDGDSSPDTPRLPLDIEYRLGLLCDRFMEELRAGRRPGIADFLAEIDEPAQPVLLLELVKEELEFRRGRGESPALGEYLQTFSPFAAVLALAFAEGSTQSGSAPTSPYLPAAGDHLKPGTRLDRYEILECIGKGGMGQVYRAWSVNLQREVALKVIRADFANDPVWKERFWREGRLPAKLSHANVATVHDLGEDRGILYLVLELVKGRALADHLQGGKRLPLREAMDICRQIADALAAAHDAGVIHRDLKPGNVMVTAEGQVKVLDFGLARSTSPTEEHTATSGVTGTVPYMSPEQARGASLDRRCDVWAFGCVLYETLTGKRAFPDGPPNNLDREPDWSALAGLPSRVVLLLRRCLQKDPKRRLRDLGDARLELEEAEVATEPAPPHYSRWRWVAVAGLLALATFALGMLTQYLRETRVPLPEPSPAQRGWSGQFLLGGATRAFGPRVSPNGDWLAFGVLKEGQAQVGVMHLATGNWRVLSQSRSRGGLVSGVCWSGDSHLYFDRFHDTPVGVYKCKFNPLRVEAPQETEILSGVQCPQVAADGSLIVCALEDGRAYRLHRHWLKKERSEPVGPRVEFSGGWPVPVRALRKKNQLVFCGKVQNGKEEPPRRRFYLLDLDSGKHRPLRTEEATTDFVPLALSPDDRFAYTVLPAGDLFRVLRIPLEGGEPEPLLTLATPAFGLDVWQKDGQEILYLDQFSRSLEALRFHATEKGVPERAASPSLWRETEMDTQPVELPDGRVLLPSKVAGRHQLLVGAAKKDPTPLLEEYAGETAPPLSLLDDRRLALVIGSGRDRRLAITEATKAGWDLPRPLKGVPGEGLTALAASPKGETLYYVRLRKVWKVPANGKSAPEEICPGDGVAVHPSNGKLLIQRFEKSGVQLRWHGPGEKPIDVPKGDIRLAPQALGERAIDKDGRVLVTVTTTDYWFWRPGLLHPPQKGAPCKLERIEVDFDGDIYPANWGRKGKVLGMGYSLRSELWRLTPDAKRRRVEATERKEGR